MTDSMKKCELSDEDIDRIVQKYEVDELQLSTAYRDGSIDPLWGRFARAVSNQMESGDATFSRYAIWANTVRDNITEAMELMEAAETEEARRLMIRAANSLSAFADIQAYFDPFGLGERQ